MGNFLHWFCRSAVCAGPTPRPIKPAMVETGRGRDIGEAQHADATLSTAVETCEVGIDSFTRVEGHASKAVA
jgi:hypothetical protein